CSKRSSKATPKSSPRSPIAATAKSHSTSRSATKMAKRSISQSMSNSSAAETKVDFEIPELMEFLFHPARYKVLHGGRGSAKSWSAARALILLAAKKKLRILCARETQI